MLNFLFSIFTLNLKNGLLLIDKVELHLHPRWQILLLEILQELSSYNQVIITTHSGTFLTADSIRSVIRIYKDNNNTSRAIKLATRTNETTRDVIHIINAHNNEKMFFADKIILVEGIVDRLIFERLVSLYNNVSEREQIIEVLEVYGKMNFNKYYLFLKSMGVTVFIIADRDYVYNVGKKQLGDLLVKDIDAVGKKVLKDKKSRDRRALAQEIDVAIRTGDLTALGQLWDYIKDRHVHFQSNLSEEQQRRVDTFFEDQRRTGVFILRHGEIEDYLPTGQTSLDSVIELLEDEPFENWMRISWNKDTIVELREIAAIVVGVDKAAREEVDRRYGTLLPIT